MIATSDLHACRSLLKTGSRTFFAASLLLPREVREAAIGLYAFCRLADDAVDLNDDRLNAVDRLMHRLDAAYAGRPLDLPADRAFADVVAHFEIPRPLPEALLEGLAWDADGRRYATADELVAYAVRVAGTVGAMMSLLMRRRDPAVVGRACDLGIAMQLTNIARDVGEDARAGRLYLPLQWLSEEGIDPAQWLAAPRHDQRIGSVVGRLLNFADSFYRRSVAGIGALPLSCRPGIHAAALIYAEIGREIERGGCDSVSRRAVVPGSRKLRLLGQALTMSFDQPGVIVDHIEPAARFLVSALGSPAVVPRVAARQKTKSTLERAVWLLELFERLERREQVFRTGNSS